MLSDWMSDRGITASDQLLFRTRNDTRPSGSNWGRSWHRALRSIGEPTLRIYDCRHAAATTWLKAGMPLGEVARRLGHSVDTLVNNYVGALSDDEQASNERMNRFYSNSSEPSA
ncbi:MAG: tyrosine-type recombinase/integrase [Ilumatobacteraceae bacterium]